MAYCPQITPSYAARSLNGELFFQTRCPSYLPTNRLHWMALATKTLKVENLT